MELRDYLLVFRRQWWLIAVLAVVGAGVATAWTLSRTPIYRGTSSVLVQPVSINRFQGTQRLDQQVNINNERQVALSSAVAARAGRFLNSPAPPSELLEHASVDVPTDSQVLEINYSDPIPRTAQRGADSFARAYIEYRRAGIARQVEASKATLSKQVDTLSARVPKLDAIISSPDASSSEKTEANAQKTTYQQRISSLSEQVAQLEQLDPTPGQVIQAATLPTSPVSPKKYLDIGLGLFVGLFLGLVGGFVRDRSDKRLRGREDLAERLDRPVLASIPTLSRYKRRDRGFGWTRRRSSSLVTLDQPTSPAAEAYRTLRTRIARLAAQLDIDSIMVVSGNVAEGKSTTAANLAVALAESGRDVLLVSADLRRPRVHEFFALPNRSGLADLLADGKVANPEAPQRSKQVAVELWSVAPHLWVILAGPPPIHPSTLMDSDAMREFLKEQRDAFDFIILDCPPALVVSDSLALAPLVDAVLVVADAKSTDRDTVDQLREQLEEVGGRIVGSVLNRSAEATRSRYYYEYQD
ncbi:MAG TPA: polysaccharide biosynthesis tyrosine autokinase [Actinomycetes bacterium]|nr:polysaccharide biosynthesis tyrosine autokinase [Actinomycetes bacterium]